MSLPMVLGTITFITPSTAGDTVTGTFMFNVTVTNATLPNSTLCTFATPVFGIFANVSNFSYLGVDSVYNVSNSTIVLTEGADVVLTVNCTNETTTEQNTLLINIDNTNPTCAFTTDLATTSRQSGSGITVADESSDTTDLTYSYVLTNEAGTSTATSTSQNPNFANGDIGDIGDFTVTSTITDEASLQSSCTQTFFVTGSDSGDVLPIALISGIPFIGGLDQTTIIIIVIVTIAIVLVVVVVIFWFVGKTKKRK